MSDQGQTGEVDLSEALPKRAFVAPAGQPAFFAALEERPRFSKVLLVISVVATSVAMALQWRMDNRGQTLEANTVAPFDIKVGPNDAQEIVDSEWTQIQQDAAAEMVPRVFTYERALLEGLNDRLENAFKDARAERERANAKKTFGARLKAEVSDQSLNALVQNRFAPSLEAIAENLLQGLLAQPVIAEEDLTSQDWDNGIVVLDGTAEGGKRLREVGSIRRLRGLVDELPRRFDQSAQLILGGRAAPQWEDYAAAKAAVVEILSVLAQPNLSFNEEVTELERRRAREMVEPVVYNVRAGQTVLRRGDVVTRRHVVIWDALTEQEAEANWLSTFLGAMLGIACLLWLASRLRISRAPLKARDLVFLALIFLLLVAATRFFASFADSLEASAIVDAEPAMLLLMPLCAASMVVRMVLGRENGMVFALLGAAMIGLAYQDSAFLMLYAMVGGTAGATLIRGLSSRVDILLVGAKVGLAQALTVLAMMLFVGDATWSAYGLNALAALVSGVVAAVAAMGLTPLVEAAFGYTTDLKLLELANLNHPALKELIVQAPGTYHHSVIVGSLVEAAAEAIGANPLLARVMAYYHDLGKGCNAMYFIENQRAGNNPHAKLKPHMSAMIIRRHVTDGLRIAEEHALGEQILAGIAEHHGTTLMQYFYAKAKEHEDEDNPVRESDYRYNGRKPQTRESALVMLGDSVEAACRSIPDPTVPRLQGMVNKVINTKFTDSQLEECDLTLRDLHVIAKAFMDVLKSIYHQRVEYPDLKPEKGEAKTESKADTAVESKGKDKDKGKAKGKGKGNTKAPTQAKEKGAKGSDAASSTKSKKSKKAEDEPRVTSKPGGAAEESANEGGSESADGAGSDSGSGDAGEDGGAGLKRLGLSEGRDVHRDHG